MPLFPVKDCIFPLFFISTRPAKTEVAKPLTMGVSRETQTAALEEGYEEYDDGSGMIDPNTGMPIAAADGNKGMCLFFSHLNLMLPGYGFDASSPQ